MPPPTTRMGWPCSSTADPLDFPIKFDAGILFHALAHGLAQCLDVGGAGATEIDQKIAMQFRDLRIADRKPTAICAVDKLPRFMPRRILEGRASGAALSRRRCV